MAKRKLNAVVCTPIEIGTINGITYWVTTGCLGRVDRQVQIGSNVFFTCADCVIRRPLPPKRAKR